MHLFPRKTVIQSCFSLGLSLSYDRFLSICNNISLNMSEKYDFEGAFVARHLTLEAFTIIAKDNIWTSILYQLS